MQARKTAIGLVNRGTHLIKGKGAAGLESALRLFDQAVTLDPTLVAAWLAKAKAHLFLGEYIDSLITLDKAAALDPNESSLQFLRDQIVSAAVNSSYMEELAEGDSSLIFQAHIQPEYLTELAEFKAKHRETHKQSFEQQVDWILSCLRFIFKYQNTKEYAFVKPAFNDSSDAGKALKLRTLTAPLIVVYNKKYIKAEKKDQPRPGTVAAFFEAEAERILKEQSKNLYIEHNINLWSMIFETIYQFPRDIRDKLAKKIPLSWYSLEFGKVLFPKKFDADKYLLFFLTPGLDVSTRNILFGYHSSIAAHPLLILTVLPDINQSDLRILENLFISIKSHIKDDSYSQVEPVAELPNIKSLVWYFKNKFNFYRLLSQLPSRAEACSTITDRLMVLRQLQVVGEIFAARNMGPYLKSIEYIDPKVLLYIRNGFSHPETLSPGFIESLEAQDEAQFIALLSDLVRLKFNLSKDIANWHKQFGDWPLVRGGEAHQEDMALYWKKIKEIYTKFSDVDAEDEDDQADDTVSVFDFKTFSPGTGLLDPDDITYILSEIDTEKETRSAEIRDMLEGRIPFDKDRFWRYEKIGERQLRDGTIKVLTREDLLPLKKLDDKKATRDRRQKIETLVYAARDRYDELRTTAQKDYSTRKQTQHDELQAKREIATLRDYPAIHALFLRMKEARSSQTKMTTRDLVECLQSRIRLVAGLLLENDIDNVANEGMIELEKLLNEDLDLSMAFSYLIGQIVSLMNNLACQDVNVLSMIDEGLNKRLLDYIALRNALEHLDPIIETRSSAYFELQNDLPKPIAFFIHELLDIYYPSIMEFDMDRITQAATATTGASTAPRKRVKQHKPLSISGAFTEDSVSASTSSSSRSTSSSRESTPPSSPPPQPSMHSSSPPQPSPPSPREASRSLAGTLFSLSPIQVSHSSREETTPTITSDRRVRRDGKK